MSLPLQQHIEKDGFRLRGLEFSRIDAFADVVFGFALTLLVVSLEIPKTYAELHASLRGFFPFAICFFFLMMVWVAHYRFFRRFGTHDTGTIVINALLLFVVLFYVYPLKFLFTFLANLMMGSSENYFDTWQQVRELMLLYGVGFATVYLLIGALYWNGYRQRGHLALTPPEIILARSYIQDSVGVACIGILSCVVALVLPATRSGLCGWVYTLIYPFKLIHGRWTRRQLAAQTALKKRPSTHH
jgi:uncharacterized membrane protein